MNSEERRKAKHDRKRQKFEQRLVKEGGKILSAEDAAKKQEAAMTAKEAQESWEKNEGVFNFAMPFFTFGEYERAVVTRTPADDPDRMLAQAKERIKSRWIKDKRENSKPISNQGMTRAEMAARVDERIFGIDDASKSREYLYRFENGEAEVVNGDDWIHAAAYELEKAFRV